MSDTGSNSHRVRGGALLVTAILLLGSATLRIGVQAQTTIARDLPESVESTREAEHSEPAPEDLQRLITALRNREQRANRREVQIEDRMKVLEIAEETIERKLAALIGAEERLSATLAMADGASEADLTRLTDVYEKMKPKVAAALFEEMAPEFAAGFLGRMRPAAAASVMTNMKPKTAYTISVILAGRNAWVPKE